MLSCQNRIPRKGEGRLHASHSLYHNADLRVIFDDPVIMHDLLLVGISREITEIQDIFH